MQKYIDENPIVLREKAQQAYMAGDTEKAELFDALAYMLDTEEEQADRIWELEKAAEDFIDHAAYVQFFEDCFHMLDGTYPCPSVTNEPDCAVIFRAIKKWEQNEKCE